VVLDNFRRLAAHLKHHEGSTAEHEAVVDLLVLTVYSDRRVTQDELDALDQFDLDHANWDSGPFSVQQYLPNSVAKVRSAIDAPGGANKMLAEVAAAISDPAMKTLALDSCQAIASSGGTAQAETDFIEQLRHALAAPRT
jgi:hypothetical protein